ncbi:MAG: leucine-rich repeat protein, partial [Oscillospiraceae bacterium]|nr:leucine-rich repeat protein [Oscillospiraceae bacterium]
CSSTCCVTEKTLIKTNFISASAEEIITSGTCGENLTWNFNEETGTLTITGIGKMTDWNYYATLPWENFQQNIKAIILDDGVTTIGDYAFRKFSNLESVSIPNSVTEIGSSAFENCSALVSISIPESVTDLGDSSFAGCSALQSVNIPNAIKTIAYGIFEDCSALESIHIPDSVTAIKNYAFSGCSSLESITISENVTEIDYRAFLECSSLTAINISENNQNYSSQDGVLFDKEKTTLMIFPAKNPITEYSIPNTVTKINQYAFRNCSVLESVMIPDNVTNIAYYTFINCSALQAIHVSENNEAYSSQDGVLFDKTKSVLFVFPSKNKILEYTIPDSVKTICSYAFEECFNLQSVVIPENLAEIELGAFYACIALESVNIPDSITTIETNVFENCSALKSITIPESVTEIGYKAFYKCSNLESITILNPTCNIIEQYTMPDTAIIYGYENSTAQAYAKKNGNRFISLGEKELTGTCGENLIWNFDSITGILTISGTGDMIDFNYYESSPEWSYLKENIKTVIIQDGVTSIGSLAFHGYSNLESVTIPNSMKVIGEHAFEYCSALESVILPENVISIGDAGFGECSNLQAITIKNPDCVISNDNIIGYCTISDTAIIYGYENSTAQAYALDWNKQFISIGKAEDITGTCGDNLTWNYNRTTRTLTISGTGKMTGVSESCPWNSFRKEIKTLVIKDGVTSIDNYAFQECSILESVTLSDSMKIINPSAFLNCPALKSITIPDSVTTVYRNAFELCTGLKSVSLSNTITEIDYGTFENCSRLESVTIPDSVKTIGNFAFKKCSSLKSITIPEHVNTIHIAFQDCYALESIAIENPDCVIFDDANTIYEKAIIYGYANSTAQAYAEKYNRKFIALEEVSEPIEIKKGDVTGDNIISIADVVFANRGVLGKESLTEQQTKCADIDNDGYVTALDALNIMKYVVGLIDNFD